MATTGHVQLASGHVGDGAPARGSRAVDRDPRLRGRLLRQFDHGARILRGMLDERFGDQDLDVLIAEARAEYERVIERLPWIGGRANPRSFSLYGSAFWLALWRVLEPRGLTLEEATPLFCDMFTAYWGRYPSALRHFYGRVRTGPSNQKRVRRLAVLSDQREHPFDYVSRYVPGEPGRFDLGIDFLECGIVKFLASEGAEELAPVLCELDWPHAEVLGLELQRTQTIAQGGDHCDFRFSRRGARDVGVARATLASVLVHGLLGWAAYAALMGILAAWAPPGAAIVVRAMGAPIIFSAVTTHLYRRSGYRAPVAVGSAFAAIVVALDAAVVAAIGQGSPAMFASVSVLGTWLPVALIFVSSLVTGLLVRDLGSRRV